MTSLDLPPTKSDPAQHLAELISLTASNSSSSPDSVTACRKLRIATRKSPLALWQAEYIAQRLQQVGVESELVPLVSTGDVDMRPIDGSRQFGLFTKRIQQALTDDEADVAVHSLKDLPTEKDHRFVVAAIPERENVQDCLVSPEAWTIDQLPQKARIGTGSKRRAAQLLNLRNDLQLEPIRGNVQTRLSKVESGEFDAIVLANAGVLRLKMSDLSRCILPLDQMLPAPGQGALGIEVRSDDHEAVAAFKSIDDPTAHACVVAERTLLAKLNGGCLAPIAAYGQIDGSTLRLEAVVLSSDGAKKLSDNDKTELDPEDTSGWNSIAQSLAEKVSKRLADAGADDLIHQAR